MSKLKNQDVLILSQALRAPHSLVGAKLTYAIGLNVRRIGPFVDSIQLAVNEIIVRLGEKKEDGSHTVLPENTEAFLKEREEFYKSDSGFEVHQVDFAEYAERNADAKSENAILAAYLVREPE
jgi:hypothetical protein